jgi:hypothetical protein
MHLFHYVSWHVAPNRQSDQFTHIAQGQAADIQPLKAIVPNNVSQGSG